VRRRWKDVHHAEALSRGFREGVVGVAGSRELGVRIKAIGADLGISESCLADWVSQAGRDGGTGEGPSSEGQAENRELRRRVRLLEQENEVLRRSAAYLSQAQLSGR